MPLAIRFTPRLARLARSNSRTAQARGAGLLVALLVLLGSLGGCASVSPISAPSFALADLQPLEAGLIEQRFRIGLRVTNPNDRPLTLRGGSAELLVNGLDFATGVTDEPIRIPAYGEDVVYLTASTNVTKLLSQLGRIAGERALSYQLKGRVRVDPLPFAVPLSDSGTIALSDLTALTRSAR